MKFNSTKYNEHWDEEVLSNLGNFQRGKSKHRPRNDPRLFLNGSHPLIQTGDVKNADLYINSHNACYNDYGLKQSAIWPKNTLCITIAANIAETGILAYPMCFPDSIVGFNANSKKTSELFMHYVFSFIRNSIQKTAIGSIQDNINIDFLKDLVLRIPSKPTQDTICSVLEKLDKKIALNKKIINQLKDNIQLIYNYWFVQFDFPNEDSKPYKYSGGKMIFNEIFKLDVPFGWEVKKLGDVIPTVLGGTPSTTNPANWTNGNIHWLSSGEIEQFPILSSEKKVTLRGIKNSVAEVLPKGSILISIVRHLRVSILAMDSSFNQSVVALPEKDNFKKEFLYPWLINELPRLSALRTGAQQPHINQDLVDDSKIILPPDFLLEKYSEIVAPIFEQINNIAFENLKLQKLRDWLLSMLMNGQVKVRN